jgi:protein involved in polysaccharide export with SLBB domain
LLKDFSTRYAYIAGQVRSEVFYLLVEGDLRLEKLVENAGGFGRSAARELVILRGEEVLVVPWKSDPKWKHVRVCAGDLVFVGTHEIY